MHIGTYTFEQFKELAAAFHGYPAPGLLIGGFMVEKARSAIPEGTLFDAVVESKKCLPDAVQILTPCSVGNGWMRILNFGRYALTLFDKHTGQGWRVWLDAAKLQEWPEICDWLFKRKAKKDQDTTRLFEQIEAAGDAYMSLAVVQVSPRFLKKQRLGEIAVCPLCHEAYPRNDGAICRGCQGETPYIQSDAPIAKPEAPQELFSVPVEEAVGKQLLHDMTQIVPHVSKGPAFRAGQTLQAGDLCRLQQMGRSRVYIQEPSRISEEWIHENEAVLAFAERMTGAGVCYDTPPSEGKISFRAARNGLLSLNRRVLEQFNLVPDVMCATRHDAVLLEQGKAFAGCRAIPLYISRESFSRALAALEGAPTFRIDPLKPAQVGVLVTGTEVSLGLIEDKFQPVIADKLEKLGCSVRMSRIVPDEASAIAGNVQAMLDAGVDLIITTAGLSVDPDDQTRQGLIQAGLCNVLYGAPILPGAMTLIGNVGSSKVIGVPACALFFKTTSLDLLLPRILAGREITRQELASMAEGGFCLGCKACTFPKCPFGK